MNTQSARGNCVVIYRLCWLDGFLVGGWWVLICWEWRS